MVFKNILNKILLLGVATSFAATESVELTGKVLDQDNNAVPFVEVVLEGQDLKDTTGSDGTWSFQSEISSVLNVNSPVLEMRGSLLSFELDKSTSFSFSIFNAQGALIDFKKMGEILVGKHQFDLSSYVPKSSLGQYYLKVELGTEVYSQKIQLNKGAELQVLRREALAPSVTDKLVYKLQGQILSEDQISSYKQYIEKFLTIRNISGKFNLDTLGRTTVKEVWAHVSGGNMATPLITRLGWSKSNNTYSGKVYGVMPQGGQVFDFNAWVEGRDSLGHKTTQSQTLEFDSFYGDLGLDDAMVGNALPTPTFQGGYFRNEIINVEKMFGASDDFGGEIQSLIFSSSSGGGMVNDSNQFVPPDSGNISGVLEIMDNDSNVVSYSFSLFDYGENWKRLNPDSITSSSYLDARDGHTYSTVVIREIEWMTQNLVFKSEVVASSCRPEDPTCERYGRFYLSSDRSQCPLNWRLPTEDDLNKLRIASCYQLDTLGQQVVDNSCGSISLKSVDFDKISKSTWPFGKSNNAFGLNMAPSSLSFNNVFEDKIRASFHLNENAGRKIVVIGGSYIESNDFGPATSAPVRCVRDKQN